MQPTEHEDSIEELSADGFSDEGVPSRRSNRSFDGPDTVRAEHSSKLG